jgi:hypothetical protein
MPKFLERKLKEEYGEKSAIPYKVMNSIGAMHGSKETAKGREMEAKHEKDTAMKSHNIREMRIEVHRDGKKVTGHTVHHHMMPTNASKSGAFMEETHHSFPFGADGESTTHGNMLEHIGQQLKLEGAGEHHEAAAEEPEHDEAAGEY